MPQLFRAPLADMLHPCSHPAALRVLRLLQRADRRRTETTKPTDKQGMRVVRLPEIIRMQQQGLEHCQQTNDLGLPYRLLSKTVSAICSKLVESRHSLLHLPL